MCVEDEKMCVGDEMMCVEEENFCVGEETMCVEDEKISVGDEKMCVEDEIKWLGWEEVGEKVKKRYMILDRFGIDFDLFGSNYAGFGIILEIGG